MDYKIFKGVEMNWIEIFGFVFLLAMIGFGVWGGWLNVKEARDEGERMQSCPLDHKKQQTKYCPECGREKIWKTI